MNYTKTIVCLANSRKPPSGRCVAGREVTSSGFGAWVRPVSARSTREISEEERRYNDGSDPRVLDVIEIRMKRFEPVLHQTENHLIDDRCCWAKVRTSSWDEIGSAFEAFDGPLWINGSSSIHGRNDRVEERRLCDIPRSLMLVRPESLSIAVTSEGGEIGPARRRVRARFKLSGYEYFLVVTDPHVERHYLSGDDGERSIGDAIICVSLGEVFHGFAYKIAAGILTP